MEVTSMQQLPKINRRIVKEEHGHFVNSNEFWSNVIPYLDTLTLKTLTTLNHRLHNTILSQEFTPYYRPVLEILVTYIPRSSNVTAFPLKEPLFGLDTMSDVNKRCVEVEKIVKIEGETDDVSTDDDYNESRKTRTERLMMRMHFEFCRPNIQPDNSFKPLDGVVVITERSYVNMRSLRKKLGCENQDVPVVVINKDSTPFIPHLHNRWSSNMPFKVLETGEEPCNEQQDEHCPEGSRKGEKPTTLFSNSLIESQVVQFFAQKCPLSQLVTTTLKPYYENISRLLNLSQPEFFSLVDQSSQVYRMAYESAPLNPWNGFLRAICFSQFDVHIQQQILNKFFRHYVGYKPHLYNVIHMTENVNEEVSKMGEGLFEDLNEMMYRQTRKPYSPVSLKYNPLTKSFIVRYWQVELNVGDTHCHRVAITIPTNMVDDFGSGIEVSTEVVSKQVHYGRKFVSSVQTCVDYWVTLFKDDDDE